MNKDKLRLTGRFQGFLGPVSWIRFSGWMSKADWASYEDSRDQIPISISIIIPIYPLVPTKNRKKL
jgi:hypothetical protein